MSEMNIKELAARVIMADPKELADAIQEVAETKRVLDRIGGKRLGGAAGVEADMPCLHPGVKFEPLKTMSPIAILQSKYGYKFEVRERDNAVLVRRVTAAKNSHYIVSQSILSVKAVDGGGYRARLDIDGHRAFLFDLGCGYSRALSMAVRAAIAWHKITARKHHKAKGGEA